MLNSNHMPVAGAIQQRLDRNQMEGARAVAQLASGKRINRAADDSADSAIVAKFAAQRRSRQAVIGNLERGMSTLEVADGGLNRIQDALRRLRELATMAADASYDSSQRGYANTEAQALVEHIDTIARTTRANDQVTPLASQKIDVVFAVHSYSNMGPSLTALQTAVSTFADTVAASGGGLELGLVNVNVVSSQKGDSIDSTVKLADLGGSEFQSELNSLTATGSIAGAFESLMNLIGADTTVGDQTYPAGGEASNPDTVNFRSTADDRRVIFITDGDPFQAGSPSASAVAQAYTDAGVSIDVIGIGNVFESHYRGVVEPTGGNFYKTGNASGIAGVLDTIAAGFGSGPVGATEFDLQVDIDVGDTLTTGLPINLLPSKLGIDQISLLSQDSARTAMDTVDSARAATSNSQAMIGGLMARVSSIIETQRERSTMDAATLSRIEDADFAQATSDLARTNVLMQSSTALLTQVMDLSAEITLKLLRG